MLHRVGRICRRVACKQTAPSALVDLSNGTKMRSANATDSFRQLHLKGPYHLLVTSSGAKPAFSRSLFGTDIRLICMLLRSTRLVNLSALTTSALACATRA